MKTAVQLIDWEKITIEEAQELADILCSAFSVIAKCCGSSETRDVSYLTIVCPYDDNLHSEYSKKEFLQNQCKAKV